MSQMRNQDITQIVQKFSQLNSSSTSRVGPTIDSVNQSSPDKHHASIVPLKRKYSSKFKGLQIKGYVKGNSNEITIVNESVRTINRDDLIETPQILNRVTIDNTLGILEKDKSMISTVEKRVDLKKSLNDEPSFKQLTRIESIQSIEANFDTQADEFTGPGVRTTSIQLRNRGNNESQHSSCKNLQVLQNTKNRYPIVKTKTTKQKQFPRPPQFEEHRLLPQYEEPRPQELQNPYRKKYYQPYLKNLQLNTPHDYSIQHISNSNSASSISNQNKNPGRRSLVSNSLDNVKELKQSQSSYFQLSRLESVMKNKDNQSLSREYGIKNQHKFNSQQIIIPITQRVDQQLLQQHIESLKNKEKKFLMQPLTQALTTEQMNKKVEMLIRKQNIGRQPLKNVNVIQFELEPKDTNRSQTKIAYSQRSLKKNALTGSQNLKEKALKSERKTIIYDKSQIYNQQLPLPTIEEGAQSLNLDLNQELDRVKDRLSTQTRMLEQSRMQLQELNQNNFISTEERNRQQREINKAKKFNSNGEMKNSKIVQEIMRDKQVLNIDISTNDLKRNKKAQKVSISVNLQSPTAAQINEIPIKKPVFQIDNRHTKEMGTVISPMMMRKSPSEFSVNESDVVNYDSFQNSSQNLKSVLNRQQSGSDSKQKNRYEERMTTINSQSPNDRSSNVQEHRNPSTQPLSPAMESVIRQFQSKENTHGRNNQNPTSSVEKLACQIAIKSVKKSEQLKQKQKKIQQVSQSIHINTLNNVLNVPSNHYRKISRIPVTKSQNKKFKTIENPINFEKIQFTSHEKQDKSNNQDSSQQKMHLAKNNKMNFKQQIDQYNHNRSVSIQGSKFVKAQALSPKSFDKIERYKNNIISGRRQLQNHFDINNSLRVTEPAGSIQYKYEERIDTDIVLQSNQVKYSGSHEDSFDENTANSQENSIVFRDDQLQIIQEQYESNIGTGKTSIHDITSANNRIAGQQIDPPFGSGTATPKMRFKQMKGRDLRIEVQHGSAATSRKLQGQQVLVLDPVTNKPFKEHVRMVYANSHLESQQNSKMLRQPNTHRNKEILSPYLSLQQTQLNSSQQPAAVKLPRYDGYKANNRAIEISVSQMPQVQPFQPLQKIRNDAIRQSQRIEQTIQRHKDDRYRIGASKFELGDVKYKAGKQSILVDINKHQLSFQDQPLKLNLQMSPQNYIVQLGQKGLQSPYSRQTSFVTDSRSPGTGPGNIGNELMLQSTLIKQIPNSLKVYQNTVVSQPQALLSPRPGNILLQSGGGVFIKDNSKDNHHTTLYSPDPNTPKQDTNGFEQAHNEDSSSKGKQLIHSKQTSQMQYPDMTIRASPEISYPQIKNQLPDITDGAMTESYTFYQETLNSFRGQATSKNPIILQKNGNILSQPISPYKQNDSSNVGRSKTNAMLPLNQVQIDQASLQNLGAKSSDRSPNSFAQTLQTIGSEQGRADEQLVWEINQQQ